MAVANIAPFGKFTGLGALGVAIPGGQLFTYLAGTTTKTNTYTSASESTANTNPVIMDANGQANIFLDSATNYKFVFSPPTDTDPPTNPYWTVDNIQPLFIASGAAALSPGATIGIGGDGTYTSPVFTGAGNITANLTLATVNASPGTYASPNSITVNAKGLATTVTSGGTALFTYSVASGTASAETITASTWNTRVINTTVVNNITGASLAANQITLANAGTYEFYIEQTVNASTNQVNKGRLRNVTASTTAIDGMNTTSATIVVQGVVTIASSTVFSVQAWTTGTAPNGGQAASATDNEVYVSIYIRKIA